MGDTLSHTTYRNHYSPSSYLIDRTDLTFELEETHTIVTSQLSMRVNPDMTSAVADLVLHGEMLELLSVTLDGDVLDASQYQKDESALTLFNIPKACELIIKTRIKPHENTALSGLYQSAKNVCTQCEAEGFRRITYFLDRPDVLSRFTTTIIADSTRYPILLSNGNKTHSEMLPDGKQKVVWVDPFKKPCYLFALVAGYFDLVEDFFVTQSGRRITLAIYVEKGNADKCAVAMGGLKKAMKWDEEKFGREYDLDIYMIVAVSDFNMGAMENKGLNVFNTQYVLSCPKTATDSDCIAIESVIAHEYFHNWTGNRVTCRDWFQLSLKEGLTVFRDQSFTADTTSATVARIDDVIDLRNSQFVEDAGPLAHPVRPDSYQEINNFYTSTIYNKGAEVIRMQRTLLGEAGFRKAMDLYFERHDGQAVTIEDFVRCMEDSSGINLEQFRLWYSQAGTPNVDVTDEYDAVKKQYTLTLTQRTAPTPGQPEKKPFFIPIKMGLLDETGKELENDLFVLEEQAQSFVFKDVITQPIPSLLRSFSAPVKLHYDYSDSALQCLAKHDTDGFNRYEAGQRYVMKLILNLINDYQTKKVLALPDAYLQMIKHLLLTMQNDKMLLVRMLSLPSEKYIAEQMPVIDVDAIYQVKEFVSRSIADALQDIFVKYYQDNAVAAADPWNMETVGKRQLKNTCLSYLMTLEKKQYQALALTQFNASLASNMTDTMGSMRAISNSENAERDSTLEQFYQHWQKDALVVDKWLILQAASKLPDTLSRVKSIMTHAAFDIKNPNKVYALLGVFSRNAIHFHKMNGEGYQFVADCILQLDKLNPQVAAHLVKPFSEWRRYNETRQHLMRNHLEALLKHPLSSDVKELVSKSLG